MDTSGNRGFNIEELELNFNSKLLGVVGKNSKNEKELKPTYGKSDGNQDGYLAYKKLQLDVQDIVSDISERQFLALLDRYESSRHGKISFADFLQFIKDNAMQIANFDMSTNDDNTGRVFDRLEKKDDDTEVSSIFNVSHPREMEWRLKIFLQNLEAYLVKIALETSRTRLIGLSGAAAEENYKHLSRYTCEQHESIALSTLNKMFAPFAAESMQGDPKNSENCVDFNGFFSVIRSFQFPGCPTVKPEVVEHLFNLCSTRLERKQGADVDTPILSAEGEAIASPALLIKLIFGKPELLAAQRPLTAPAVVSSPRGSKGRKGKKAQKAVSATLLRPLDIIKGKALKTGAIRKSMDENRDQIGFGPVRMNGLTRPNIMSVQSIKYNTSVLATPVPAAEPETKKSQFDLPLKIATRRSRTSLPVPTRLDSVVAIQRSNTLPKQELRRKHVFGMSSTLYSGSAIHILPDHPDLDTPVARNESTDSRNIEKERDLFLDNAVVAYPSAGLGVVHNLSVNRQTHYNGHIEDVTCMAISVDGSLAATGCNGKSPTVHIWATEVTDPLTPLLIIGKGFFFRGVCAVEFSFDSQYLVAVGCDDYHMVGVFNLLNGEKVCEATGQKGLPPLIKWIRYCSDPQSTLHISKEHTIPCDLFATAGGERHIKLWSFRRPLRDGTPAALVSKVLKMGKTGATAPKTYYCCGFVPSSDEEKVGTENHAVSSHDLVAGGSNGVLYRFEKISCVVFRQAMKGKIQCLEIIAGSKAADYRVVVGGMGGMVKVFVARTFSELHSFCLADATPPPKLTRSNSNRSSSASRRSQSARTRRLSLRPEDIGKATPSGPAGDLISGDAEQPATEPRMVTGLAVNMYSTAKADASVYVIVTLGTGKAVRLDVPSSPSTVPAAANQDNNSSSHTKVSAIPATDNRNSLNNLNTFISNSSSATVPVPAVGTVLFHYHVGSLYGLATAARRLCATVGDDKQLMLWDVVDCELLAKTTLKNPSRCCHIDKSKSFIAVGCAAGSITLFHVVDDKFSGQPNPASGRRISMKLTEVVSRTDSKGECTEVKFSPSNDLIAVGTRDDIIYIYSWSSESAGTTMTTNAPSSACTMRLMHKLKGHTATILHIDWSSDSQLIRSVCNAYEIICWDVPVGKVNSTVNPEDVRWKTRHCKLGFNVMGIWPPYSNGSEVNSVDVCVEKGLVVTANDRAGLTRLFNYPCVVKIAPNKAYSGHSAHVMKCRFLVGGDTVATVGGRDASLQIWDCVP